MMDGGSVKGDCWVIMGAVGSSKTVHRLEGWISREL